MSGQNNETEQPKNKKQKTNSTSNQTTKRQAKWITI